MRTPNRSHQTRTVLEAFLRSPARWRHGYDLALETGLRSGSLYPILMRLADQEWLEHRWEDPTASRRPRHLYRLTARGKAEARALLAEARRSRRRPALDGGLA